MYSLWRELTAAEVAAAEERMRRPLRLPPASAEVEQRLRRAVAKTVVRSAPAPAAVHCAVVLPKGGGRDLRLLAAALAERASRPVHLWVLARPGIAGPERLARLVPGVGFSRVPIRGLGRVARLVLADLLPDVGRVVVLPLRSQASGDVAELAGMDLGEHSWAAPMRPDGASGFGVIHAAAARLRDRTEAAAELRRTAHARHRFDFDAFSADLLVLDLERMRREAFSAEALALVQEFGLREREVLHYVAGPGHATIPEDRAAAFTPRPDG